MKKKHDIENEADIVLLVNSFYDYVKKDNLLSPFFISVDFDKHLPIMYKFWQNILLHKGDYEGNPMARHQHINQINPIQKKHFNRWLKLFNATVDENFVGKNASTIKERAVGIATIMLQHFKIK